MNGENKWREDFPFSSEDDEHISRRDFTRFLLLVSTGFAVGNGWIWARTLKSGTAKAVGIEVAKVGELKPGEWKVFHYPDHKHPAILIRRLNGEYIAFDQKCTHLACPVAYENSEEGEGIVCHCHNGKFDINNGEGLAGPPRELRPLPRIELQFDNERILAIGFMEKKHA